MTFKLVNPSISNQEFTSKRSKANKAAAEIWKDFGKNISNYTPKFFFTLQNTNDNSLHHFKVNEKVHKDDVKLMISKVKVSTSDKDLLSQIQTGGKSYISDDDSSSSSSSEDFRYSFTTLNNSQMVLNYWPNIYGVPNVFLPSFVSTFSPMVRINIPVSTHLVIS